MKSLALVLALIGCGTQLEPRGTVLPPKKGPGIDSAFYDQIRVFEAAWGHEVRDIDVYFVPELDGDVVGVCETGGEYRRRIKIDQAAWDANDTWPFREALVLHELGHCILGRNHMDSLQENGCPVSLMNWTLGPTLKCYAHSHDWYLYELFHHK